MRFPSARRAARALTAFAMAASFGLLPHVAASANATGVCITILCGGGTGGIYVPPPWSLTGHMSTGRGHHTSTLLPNGKVLVTGGNLDQNSTATASAELFDPSAGTWSPTGSMSIAREDHTATLLGNGKVLVTGGFNERVSPIATAEIYDPLTGHFVNTSRMMLPRTDHTAALLPDGRVLVAGGRTDTDVVASSELYDPVAGTWSPTGFMLTPRSSHAAARLGNGQVLVAGGTSGHLGFPAAAEVFDPATGRWSSAGMMSSGRMFFQLTAMNVLGSKGGPPAAPAICITVVCGGYGGPVLATGGWSPKSGAMATADLYDPATRIWHAVPNMSQSRNGHTAALLANGTVLVAAGASLDADDVTSEVFDPATGHFTSLVAMNFGRMFAAATRLPNGAVLVEAGAPLGGNSVTSAEVYTP